MHNTLVVALRHLSLYYNVTRMPTLYENHLAVLAKFLATIEKILMRI